MPLSSNTLTHFTNNKENLFSILENRFKFNFCKEQIEIDTMTLEIHVAMISFCDIPMSEIYHHIEKYGSYGIGLKKDWGIKNKLNPVIYLEKSSNVSKNYLTTLKNNLTKPDTISEMSEDQLAAYNTLGYIKNYEGILDRKERKTKYRFSDEREWRLTIETTTNIESIVGRKYFNKLEHSKYLNDHSITFEPNDINYIIIADDSQIHETIHNIRDIFRQYPSIDVERLTTRILTTQRIKEDF